MLHQPEESLDQDAGLARARTGDDTHVLSFTLDRGALFGAEIHEPAFRTAAATSTRQISRKSHHSHLRRTLGSGAMRPEAISCCTRTAASTAASRSAARASGVVRSPICSKPGI